MLRLLLKKERDQLKREYTFRFFNTSLMFIILSIVITGVGLFASYIYAVVEDRIVTEQLTEFTSSENAQQRREIATLERHLILEYKLLNAPLLIPSELLTEVVKVQPEGIFISSFDFERRTNDDEEVFFMIDLRGTAVSRGVLIEYADALKGIEGFAFVHVPVSSFTIETDVPFNISVSTEIIKN